MPGPARLITLNLGSQTVGVAEFRVAHGGLVFVNYRLREVPLDPETGHRRDAHVAFEEAAAVLREMMQEMRIPQRPVNYALPAQTVFARFVKLPPLVQEKLHQIVSFEAQQNVPFPLDEVVWDYQLVGGGLGEQIQVVLVAIKVDLLDQINEAVEGTGLQTSIVDIAPMALYNAFRNSYPEVGDCSLLLDIGARTTNILFIESGRIFLRSIPLGGSAITAAIAQGIQRIICRGGNSQEAGWLCGAGRRICRTCRSQRCAGFENRAQHHDPAPCRIDAFHHALPRPTAGKSPGSHFPVWRRRWNALHARVLYTRNFKCRSSFSIRCKTSRLPSRRRCRTWRVPHIC